MDIISPKASSNKKTIGGSVMKPIRISPAVRKNSKVEEANLPPETEVAISFYQKVGSSGTYHHHTILCSFDTAASFFTHITIYLFLFLFPQSSLSLLFYLKTFFIYYCCYIAFFFFLF
jgi:hypothetical protein